LIDLLSDRLCLDLAPECVVLLVVAVFAVVGLLRIMLLVIVGVVVSSLLPLEPRRILLHLIPVVAVLVLVSIVFGPVSALIFVRQLSMGHLWPIPIGFAPFLRYPGLLYRGFLVAHMHLLSDRCFDRFLVVVTTRVGFIEAFITLDEILGGWSFGLIRFA